MRVAAFRFAGDASTRLRAETEHRVSEVVRTNSPIATQWWVQIRGRSFGPYTIEQMARFMSEGRVRPSTMVADNPHTGWLEARKVMSLRGLRTPVAAND